MPKRLRIPATLPPKVMSLFRVQGYAPSILLAHDSQEMDFYEIRDRNDNLKWASVHPDLFESIAFAKLAGVYQEAVQ